VNLIMFAVGLTLLVSGGTALVRGSSRIAASLGISPLVIGLTLVAFGTSSPELAVSMKSVLSNQSGIALGNVVGSNIFNILVILGISALIVPLKVAQQLIRIDVPLMIILSVIALILSLDRQFGRVDGLIFITCLILYIFFLIYQSRKESKEVVAEYAYNYSQIIVRQGFWIKNIFLIAAGFVLLILGSRWLVDSAVSLARYLGVSELIIGLTIVAVGTSLPELATSVIAAMRRERDIAVGNVIGSNIFNLVGVLGISSVVSRNGVEVPASIIGFDYPVMIAVAIVCLPIFFTGGIISRKEGAILLGYYIIYTSYLVLNASHHDQLPIFSYVVLCLVVPFTVIILIIASLQELRKT